MHVNVCTCVCAVGACICVYTCMFVCTKVLRSTQNALSEVQAGNGEGKL